MSYYKMIDVSDKLNTKRIAIASGTIHVGEYVFGLIKNNQMIKGDPIRLAEIAAIMGAKQTSNLIPLCHPLGLDKVEFVSELIDKEFAIKVYCIAITSSKTGVEMEALTGVMTGLLTIYDLSKISEPSLTIGNVHLIIKIGGKSGVWINPVVSEIPSWINKYLPTSPDLSGLQFSSITLSDRASSGVYEDKSGQILNELVTELGGKIIEHIILSDDKETLKNKLNEIINQSHPQVIITTGGTGISSRDITTDTILGLGGREIPGIGELLRIYGSKFTNFSWASRSLGVIYNNTLIIALPGSTNAVKEGVDCLAPIIPHLVKMVNGGNHD